MDDGKTDLTHVRAGGLRWTVRRDRDDLPAAILDAAGELLGDRSHQDRMPPAEDRILKQSGIRRVRVLELQRTGRRVVLKEYRPRGAAAFARSLVLGRPAAREWNVLLHLHGAGVSVPEPLCLGEPAGPFAPGASCLALEEIEDAVNLEDVLLGRHAPPVPGAVLAAGLGRIVRAMHDAGVVHPDLHAANVLVTAEGRLVLIDFHSARIVQKSGASGSGGTPPSLAARFRDLAALSGAFLVLGTRTDRLRFFSAYCGLGRACCGLDETAGARRLAMLDDPKAAARDLETASWRRLRLFLEKRDLRPLREGRGFKRLQLHDWTGMSEDSERASRLARFLGPHPEETLEREGRTLKRDGASAVYGVALDGDRFVIKIHEPRGASAPIKHLAGGSRGRAAWLNAHRLLARALPTARPVLFLEEPVHSPGGRSLVVFEEATGLPTLDRFVQEAVEGGEKGRAALERTLHRLARTLARMHNFFMSDRDLKAQNILVALDGSPVIVDLDGVEPAGEVGLYTMARDLMRLNASFPEKGPVSIRDRLRFLAAYARARGLDRTARRALRLEVMHLTLAKWRKWKAAARPRPRGLIPSF